MALVGLAACSVTPNWSEVVSPDASANVGQVGTVVEVDFTVETQAPRRLGLLRVTELWHREDRPDRLVFIPTKILWRETIDRWRARRRAT